MALIFQSLLGFFGGLGIFLYGTHLLSDGLQKIAASKMRTYLTELTNTRLKGVFTGVVTTFFLQSSTVTSILVVGLVGSSTLSLSQAFSVILGSAIGTTFTVQILTFNISMFASLFIFIGAILSIFIKRGKWRVTGFLIFSIGLIFFGIQLISSSLGPLSEEAYFNNALISIANKPLLFAFIAMLLTALFHSSAAMIVIGIAFVATGVLSTHEVIPLVLGANVGSTIPVMITSLTSNKEGKKLAFFTFLFKITGAIIFFILLELISQSIHLLPGSPERQIAHFHTIFNVLNAILFFPLLPFISNLFNKIFKTEEEKMFEVKLDDMMLNVPEEALIDSERQVMRLSEMVQYNMIEKLPEYINGNYESEKLIKTEQLIDESYVKIQQYLLKLGQQDLTRDQSIREVKLLNILNDIENIGDTVMQIISSVEKARNSLVTFNENDIAQLKELLKHLGETYKNSLLAFKHEDLTLAKENIQAHSTMENFENDIKFTHYNSMINEKEYNASISAVYLDIINHLLQVNHYAVNISRTVLGLI